MRGGAAAWCKPWLLLVAAVLAAVCSGAHGQTVAKPNYASDKELAPSATSSGLNLVGRTFDATGPDGVQALLANYTDDAGWADTFT
jgi:hypothetical protein